MNERTRSWPVGVWLSLVVACSSQGPATEEPESPSGPTESNWQAPAPEISIPDPDTWDESVERYLFALSAPTGETFTEVSVGYYFACGLLTSGQIVCGTEWEDEERHGVPPAIDFVLMSTGSWTTCGFSRDSGTVCWGKCSRDECSPPDDDFAALASANAGAFCGLRQADAGLSCWGDNLDGLDVPGPWDTFTLAPASGLGGSAGLALAAAPGPEGGPTHTYFPDDEGIIEDFIGPPPRTDFVEAHYSGVAGFCGLTPETTIECWGNPEYEWTRRPPTTSGWQDIGGGSDGVSCGLDADGKLCSWAGDYSWEYDGPFYVDDTFEAVDCNFQMFCGIRTGGQRIRCWEGFTLSSSPDTLTSGPE